MSKFTPLQTDNPKTGPKEDSIFYRPQTTITDQYQSARLEQQQKQQRLLSKLNPPNPNHNNDNSTTNPRRTRPKLKAVTKFAVGGNRRNKPTSLKSNKPSTNAQQQLLRNYKKEHSRSQYHEFKKEDLPPGTLKCSLFKKSLGCNRGYVGHFVGSKGPRFPKSKIRAIREEDLQTQLERLQYDKSLNAKKRDQLMAQLKFGLDDDEDHRRDSRLGTREFWFDFEEAPTANTTDNGDNTDNTNAKRTWLGKPKQKDKNYSYVLMEWNGTTRNATVYPATFIEYGLSKQLLADGEATAESVEKRHRAQLAKWRRKQADKSVMEKLGNLFGHDASGNVKERKKRLRADEITDEAKAGLKEMYLEKKDLTPEEKEMLRDMLGDEMYNEFAEEYKEYHADNKRNNDGRLVTGDNTNSSLIGDRVLSKRLKTHKTRGQLETLADYDEFMSDDDGVENNLNDYDFLDENEEDMLTDEEGNESENDEMFKKLQKHIGEDLVNKEYELPEKDLKNGLFDNDSDDEDEGEVELTITDDDEDEEDDMDGNVQIVKSATSVTSGNSKSKKRKMENAPNAGPSRKKRKLNAVDENKLKEELTILITKILKKFSDGLEMLPLWKKITASLSYPQDVIKKVLPPVLKSLAKTNDKGGKKKYCLKDKYK